MEALKFLFIPEENKKKIYLCEQKDIPIKKVL